MRAGIVSRCRSRLGIVLGPCHDFVSVACAGRQHTVVSVLGVEWIDEVRHAAGMASVLAAGRRHLSLVDCVSFAVLRDLGLRDVFVFDEHFAEQEFTCLPS